MDSNICNFVSTKKYDNNLNIINFVYEKNSFSKKEYILPSTYSLGLVTGGEGILHTNTGDFEIKDGDLFVTFPAKAYYIENSEALKYIYISFIGLRAGVLLERLGINPDSPIFHGFDFLKEHWEKNFKLLDENNSDLFCESLLLYTFGFICRNNEEKIPPEKANSILIAKEYIDSNFTDCELNLQRVSEKFAYNTKYFSAAFKKLVKINFSEYLRIKRLDYARALAQNGLTNISELSELCGYKDPLYFSKCFKKQYGISPKEVSADSCLNFHI